MKTKIVILLAVLLASLLQTSSNAFDQVNISFTQQPGTPYFVGQPEMNIDAEEFTTVILRIKSEQSGMARLFWATNFDPQMNEPKSLSFSLDKSTDLKEYTFNLRRQNPNWAGFVGQLLVMPENGPAGLEMAPAWAIPGNLITDIKSGWSEFFRYETIQARTVNIIKGPQLNGRSVNFYLLILILLAFILVLTNELIKANKLDLMAKAQRALYATIIVTIILAALLEARLWIDYAKTARLDFSTLWGKTLDEKREITTGGGFYDFLSFCNKALPARVDVSLIAPEPYPKAKGGYYLYPHRVIDQAGYLIVYESNANTKNYSLFAKFNDRAYILRKTK